MNRIQRGAEHLPPKSGQTHAPEFGVDSALFTRPAARTARALFAPLHYERNYAYPLLVWLHGAGADERQLMRIMPSVSMRNYVAVAPRGVAIAREDGTEVWGWSQAPDHIQHAEQQILDCVEDAQRRFHLAPNRLFLAGFGCGGTMAFRMAMSHPARFAGVLSIGGCFPKGQNPLSQWSEARRLAVFLAVGRDSLEYAPDNACDDLRLFHAAGLSVTLRQYPCGQQLTPQILRDVDRWIIEQITAWADSAVRSGDPSSCPSD
jgi:phospholipase/carboxylesterase